MKYGFDKKGEKKYELRSLNLNENKFVCKHCGHKVLVPAFLEKNLCSWCGNWVFRDAKKEFEYRMKEKLIRGKKND